MSRLSVIRLRIKASVLVSLSLTLAFTNPNGLAQEAVEKKAAGSGVQTAKETGKNTGNGQGEASGVANGEVAEDGGKRPPAAKPSAPQPPAHQPPPEKSYAVEASVQYAHPAGKKLRADLYVPKGDGPFPGVLMIHGGGWSTGSKSQMVGHATRAANRGYTVMSINYRHAPEHKFPAQIHDCKTAIRWWRERADKYKLDTDRIAAYGYSAGGHLACMMGTCDPSLNLEGIAVPDDAPSTAVQAVVAGGAPCDFRRMPLDATFLQYWLGGTRSMKPKVYQQASPQAAVTADDAPTFFYHGQNDWLVPIRSPEKMQAELDSVGVNTDFFVCKGKGHIATFMDRDAMRMALDFLDRTLKGKVDQTLKGNADQTLKGKADQTLKGKMQNQP